MKTITVNTKEFKRGLEKIGYVKNLKGVEFLHGFYIKSEDGDCKIYRSDIENILIYKLFGVSTGEDFDIRVQGYKTMVKAFKFMTGGFTEITIKDDSIILSDGKKTMELESDNEMIDYPKVDSLEVKKVNCENLFNRIKEIDYAMSKDEYRPILKGMYFGKNDMVTLDGYRLALSTNKELKVDNPFNITDVSIEIVKKLSKDYKEDDMTLNIGYNNVEWSTGDGEISLVSKRIDGEMFDYESILRDNHSNIYDIDKKELQENLKYLKSFGIAKKKMDYVELKELNQDSLQWKLNNESGVFTANTSMKDHKLKESMNFNIHYLLDAVDNIVSDDFKLCLNGAFNPAILEGENSKHLVLPVRVSR